MRPKIRLLFLLAGLLLVACGDDPPAENDDGTKKKKDKTAEAKGPAKKADEPASGTLRVSTLPPRTFRDSDFIESEQSRDPFRNFLSEVRGKGPVVAQRTVLMPNTPINQMKLIAIVTGIDQPRAMIVDEKGVGYVTTRGDFVGRAEVVQSGGAENLPVTLNWRVDRIRENEVVLAREDPAGPNRPNLTKVIPLHEADENPDAIREARKDDSG